jgi:hypothetical protein
MRPEPEIADGTVSINLVNTMARLKDGVSLVQAEAGSTWPDCTSIWFPTSGGQSWY